MSSISRFGWFNLPKLTSFPSNINIGISNCPQPSAAFTVKVGDNVTWTLAPATLQQSAYVPLSLERAMLWHWKIKQWQVEIDAEYVVGGDPITGSFIINNLFTNPETNNFQIIENEKEKLCNPSYFSDVPDTVIDNQQGLDGITIRIGRPDLVQINYPSSPAIRRTASQGVRVDKENSIYYINTYIEIEPEFVSTLRNGTLGIGSPSPEDKLLTYTIDDGIDVFSKPFQFGNNDVTGDVLITPYSYWDYSS